MRGNKSQTVKKVDGIVRDAYMRSQWSSTPTGRPDLNEINKRNAEEERQDRRSSYRVAGVMVLLVAVVIFLVYFFT